MLISSTREDEWVCGWSIVTSDVYGLSPEWVHFYLVIRGWWKQECVCNDDRLIKSDEDVFHPSWSECIFEGAAVGVQVQEIQTCFETIKVEPRPLVTLGFTGSTGVGIPICNGGWLIITDKKVLHPGVSAFVGGSVGVGAPTTKKSKLISELSKLQFAPCPHHARANSSPFVSYNT